MLATMIDHTAEGPTIRIPRARSIEERLAALADEKRPEFVKKIKKLRLDEAKAATKYYRDNINEVTGMDVATRLTMMTDAILRVLIDRAFAKLKRQRIGKIKSGFCFGWLWPR